MADKRRSIARGVWRLASMGMIAIAAIALGALCFLLWQGSRQPATDGAYVALGSSFAAGIGLGPSADDSPVHCFRTTGGYPALLAKNTGLKLIDMSCSGSTTEHILEGGQLFLGPQVSAIGRGTVLVTITSGGNDLGYVGDLMAASGSMGRLAAWLHGPIEPVSERPYSLVEENLKAIVETAKRSAPRAKVVLVSYPAILPKVGNCAATGVSDEQAQISRSIAERLAEITRSAAEASGALYLDMHGFSQGHDVCSTQPWVNGAIVEEGTAFHPNAAGSAITAARIRELL